MKGKQYGLLIKSYERDTKGFKSFILVYYNLSQALNMDKEYRHLDSIPNYEEYLDRVRELKDLSRVRLLDVDKANIHNQRGKLYYNDRIIGDIELVNVVPIKIEGWFLVD